LRDEFNKGFEEMIKDGVPVGQAEKAFKDAYSYFDTLREVNKNNPYFDI
ncbi:Rhs family protein, partial [Cronobacter dublinensis]|nr:Rhs family protein [Cronobacter dublinensis]